MIRITTTATRQADLQALEHLLHRPDLPAQLDLDSPGAAGRHGRSPRRAGRSTRPRSSPSMLAVRLR